MHCVLLHALCIFWPVYRVCFGEGTNVLSKKYVIKLVWPKYRRVDINIIHYSVVVSTTTLCLTWQLID